jgi:uncharacterized protein (TIGR00369 family)
MIETQSLITVGEFLQLLRQGTPPATAATPVEVVTLERGLAVLRVMTGSSDLRPGGTVAGPVIFWLADLAMYAAVMSAIGNVPLAVTTDATIHFLRRPRAGALTARARVLKVGARLVVGEVQVAHEGEDEAPVAHAVMTYSRPQNEEPGHA